MRTHIQKWGNSLGIRIPISFSHQLKLKLGSSVDIQIEDDHLVILPQTYVLQEMLDAITPHNCHGQTFEDDVKGSEQW